MPKIKIEVEGNSATAYGPFPFSFVAFLGNKLSGRKTWKGDKSVKFESTPSNIRILKNSEFDLEFEDIGGKLADLAILEALSTQHDTVAPIATSYTPNKPLREYQQKIFNIMHDRKAYALLLEMGLGKTCLFIANAGSLASQGKVTGLLVFSPRGVHYQWIEEEFPKHFDPNINWSGMIWTKRPIKPQQMIAPRNGGLAVLSMNIDAMRTEKGFDTAREFLDIHGSKSMMIIDESHAIKNGESQRTLHAFELGKRAGYRRISTGTPIAKNVVDAWSQFKFLDENILGYKYISAFKARYCLLEKIEARNAKDYQNKIVGQQNTEEFYSLIAPHSYRLTKKEVLKHLPEKEYVPREYQMDTKTRRHYMELRNTFMTQLDNGEIYDVQNAAVCMLRLQQVLCGYLPITREGQDTVLEHISDDRLDVMMDIVEQLSGPVVIWARFRPDIERIVTRLKQHEGDDCVVDYYGPTREADRQENKRKFLSGRARFLVSNPASGGTGLNLQGECENAIYFSNSFASIHRWQSEDRTHRDGMLGGMTYYDIVARGTVDRTILANLRQKKSISDLTFDEIRQAIAMVPEAA